MTKLKRGNSALTRVLLICFSLIILILVCFVIASSIFLSPVNKNSDDTVKFEIKSGTSKNMIADELEKAGLIKNALFFKVYIRFNINTELYAGTYNLSKSMSVDEIINVISSNKSIENAGITVTFIEGKRLKDHAKKIAEYFDYTEEEVLKVANSEAFINNAIDKYWFVTEKVKDEKIYYPLEGYFFADTYNLKKNSTIEEILNTMLYNMGQKLNDYKEDIELSDYSVHEILTLSSIVELEGSNSNDRKGVAGVFYNRLKNGETLGSDVTTYYGVKKEFDKDLSIKNLENCNAYNTSSRSTCPIIGLPVGPIASPSLASIAATIEPEEHDYYYFVADKYGKTYFDITYKEHTQTVAKLKKDGLWYEY